MTLCGICCLHAVRRGVDYSPGSTELADGSELHEAVTTINGTAVCWYHVAHVDHDPVLSDVGRQVLAMQRAR